MNGFVSKLIGVLYNKGAFSFEGGFRYNFQKRFPNAPPSPFDLNLNNKNHQKNPGRLEAIEYDLIAQAILLKIKSPPTYDAILPLSLTAEPIVEAIMRVHPQAGSIKVISLADCQKVDSMDTTKKGGNHSRKVYKVLAVDGLIASGKTELIKLNEIKKFHRVFGLAVSANLERNGSKTIEGAGYTLYYSFTVSEAFKHLLQACKISKETYNNCIKFLLKP